MILDPEDVTDLKTALTVDPAFYKDGFVFTPSSEAIARVLRRHGVSVSVNPDTGVVRVLNP